MHSIVQKASESKQQTKAKKMPSQGVEKDNTLSIDDQRPETAMQLKLMDGAEQSTRVHQLSAYQRMADKQTAPAQRKQNSGTAAKLGGMLQRKEASNSLPEGLKAGVESLSGQSMSDVTVHRNSDKPAQLQAHAYAQGTDIHLGPGQEQHLPHEAWHVAQQKQGRVEPTTQLKAATFINDDKGLEQEADVMGAKAMQVGSQNLAPLQAKSKEESTPNSSGIVQRKKTLAPLTGEVKGMGSFLKNTFGGGTLYTNLKKKVDLFNAADDAGQVKLGKEIGALGAEWKKKHSNPESENDVKKLNDIDRLLTELATGETLNLAKQTGVLKEGEAEDLGFQEQMPELEMAKAEAIEKDNPQYISKMLDIMQSRVIDAEANTNTIDANETLLRSDAGIHTFFAEKKEAAADEAAKKDVTAHAKQAYNKSFHSKIMETVTSTKPDGTTVQEDELSLTAIKQFKNESTGSAEKVSGFNEDAESSHGQMLVYAAQLQEFEKKQADPATPETEKQSNKEAAKRNIDVSILLEEKIRLQKEKSDKLVEPLNKDGRLGTRKERFLDALKVKAVNKIVQIFTLGFVSAEAAFEQGGVSSSESFSLKADGTLDHQGTRGGSKFDFVGPRGEIKKIIEGIKKTHKQSAKFKGKQPISGFFVFAGALKQLEAGLGYIENIVSNIAAWAAGLSAIPGAVAVTGPIGSVCGVISKVISLIKKSSKVARLLFNSLVRMMNDEPAMWGLVAQNFRESAAENVAAMASEGLGAATKAGSAAILGEDPEKALQESYDDSVNMEVSMDPAEIVDLTEAESYGIPTTEKTGVAFAEEQINSKVGDQLDAGVEKVTGDKYKEDKIDAFVAATAQAPSRGNAVIAPVTTIVATTKKATTEIDQTAGAIDKGASEQAQQEASKAESGDKKEVDPSVKAKADNAKQEAGDASSLTQDLNLAGKLIVKSGHVATMKALWEKRIEEAKKG